MARDAANANGGRVNGAAGGTATGASDVAPEDARERRLTELLDEFGSGGFRLLAERSGPDGPEYLGPIPLNTDLFESVRMRWGGGLFGGRVVDERGKYKARFPQFRIAGAPVTPAAPAAPASIASGVPSLESVLLGLTVAMTKLMERMERPAAAVAVDPVEQVVKIAKALREANAPAVVAPADSMGMVRELYGFLREIREETTPPAQDNGFGLVMREGVTPLVQVLTRKLDMDESRERRRVPPSPVPMPAPARAAAAAAAPSVVPPAPVRDYEETLTVPADELEALFQTIPVAARRFLLTAAEQDEEAADYVPLLLNRLSDEGYATLVRLLPRPDFLDVLIKVVPAYGTYRAWFAVLASEIRTAVDEAAVDEAAVAPAGQGGDEPAAATP